MSITLQLFLRCLYYIQLQLSDLISCTFFVAMSIRNNQNSFGSQTSVESVDHIGSLRSSGSPTRSRLSPGIATFGCGTKARRIRLYRNGDMFYSGINMNVGSDHYRTFDTLLAEINKCSVADPAVLKKVSGLCVSSIANPQSDSR